MQQRRVAYFLHLRAAAVTVAKITGLVAIHGFCQPDGEIRDPERMAIGCRVARLNGAHRSPDKAFEQRFDAFVEMYMYEPPRRLTRQGSEKTKTLFRKRNHNFVDVLLLS